MALAAHFIPLTLSVLSSDRSFFDFSDLTLFFQASTERWLLSSTLSQPSASVSASFVGCLGAWYGAGLRYLSDVWLEMVDEDIVLEWRVMLGTLELLRVDESILVASALIC
jgi:hypothetical protein